jgi:hypothetical protein
VRQKRGDKHTARLPPTQLHAPRTRLHVAFGSPLHHRCAANIPLCRLLRSSEERRRYNARCLQIRRDGKALHGACNEVALRAVEQWVPQYLKLISNHESILSLGCREKRELKSLPSGISSSGPNWIDFPIFVIPPAVASYRTRLRWRTSTGGSASMRTC